MYIPGDFKLSKAKLKRVIKLSLLKKSEKRSIKKNIKGIKKTLREGDMQLAKVISLEPSLIACYSDEFDGVLIYQYPQEMVKLYGLSVNKHLVTCNSYWYKLFFDRPIDIILGKNCSDKWRDIITIIPLFFCQLEQETLSNNLADILFDSNKWNYLDELIKEYLEKKPNQYRNGLKVSI